MERKPFKVIAFSRKRMFKPRQYYFNIVAANGRIVANGEGYHNKKDRDDIVRRLVNYLGGSQIFDRG